MAGGSQVGGAERFRIRSWRRSLAPAITRRAEVEARFPIIGLEFHRLLEMPQRLVRAVGLLQSRAEIVMGRGMIGHDLYRPFEVCDGICDVAGAQ